jgi:hypothetical protein
MIYYSHYIAYTFGSVDVNGFLYLQCLWLQYNNTRYKKGEA